MRAFCAILLVGIVAYVQADPTGCDHLAANVTEAGTTRTGADQKNQNISLSAFLSNEQGVYKTERVTPYKNDTPQNRVETCTAPTYGEDCAGVRYFRKLIPGSQKNANSLLGVKFGTTFIGWNKEKKVAYEFTMTMVAVDSDDYIFQWDGSKIKIQKHAGSDPTNPQSEELQESDIDQEIMKVLKSQFALNSYNENGGYNLYVTCDEQNAWVTYSYNENATTSSDDGTKLEKAIEILRGSLKVNKAGKDLLASKKVIEEGFPNFAIEQLNTQNFQPTQPNLHTVRLSFLCFTYSLLS